MDRILIILKKENGPRASSAPALGLNTIIFKYVYCYMKQISGERLQDHWSSGKYKYALNVSCFNPIPTPMPSMVLKCIPFALSLVHFWFI